MAINEIHLPSSADHSLPSVNPQMVEKFPDNTVHDSVYMTPSMPEIGSDAWVAMSHEEQTQQLMRKIDLYKGIAGAVGLKVGELSELARTDQLTGLKNRLALNENLEKAVQEADNNPGSFLDLVFIDLDKFKQANDQFGHETGDLVLAKVGDVLTRFFRKGDTVARLGGDEFVVLVRSKEDVEQEELEPGMQPRDELSEDAVIGGFTTRLETAIKQAGLEAGVPFIGASIGVVSRNERESAKQLLDRGDHMMYANKRGRKDAEAVIKAVWADLRGETPAEV